MKPIILLFVIVACLSATRAAETTTESVQEAETDAPLVTVEHSVTTISPSTTPSTATTTAAPTTTKPTPTTQKYVTINRRTTTPTPTTTTRRVTTVAATPTTTSTTTTSAPTRGGRSRSRVIRVDDNESAQPQLLPIKVIKSDKSESRSRGKTVLIAAEPRQIPVKVIPSEPLPIARRNQITSTTSSAEDEKVTEKLTKSHRRGKVHYPSGKELGRDDPAVNYESKYESDKYKFSYETKDGQTRSENGIFENMGTEDQAYSVKGSYSYFDTEGIEYIVNYTADRRGFHPVITVKNKNKV